MQLRRHENGGVCCSSINDRGERIAPEHPCDKCKAHFAAIGRRILTRQESNVDDLTPPPNGYDLALARLRAAVSTTKPHFAAQPNPVDIRHRTNGPASGAFRGAPPARFTAAELATYAAP